MLLGEATRAMAIVRRRSWSNPTLSNAQSMGIALVTWAKTLSSRVNREHESSARTAMRSLRHRFVQMENVIHRTLIGHSTDLLRVSFGAVFLGFGVLKFFPGVSPAEGLVIATTDKLTLGLVPGHAALVAIATLECFIGVCMLAGRWMRLAIWLLALQFVGILSPLVLLPARLLDGPHHAPTLEGQYVLKDVILVAAGMVIAAATFRGGRLVREETSPILPADPQMADAPPRQAAPR